jgi:tetratricopeptide (TPR) repeat protein
MQVTDRSVLRWIIVGLVVAVVAMAGMVAYTFASQLFVSTPETELERAVMAAEEAVRANPEDAAARTKLAAAYLDQGLTGAAAEQAEDALKLDPSDPTPLYVLGRAQLRMGDTDQSIETLERAVNTEGQLAQFYQDAYYALSQAYEEKGDEEKALEALDEAVNNNPDNVLMVFSRAQYYERQEMWADALFDYTIVLTYVPDHEEALARYEEISDEYPDAEAQALEWVEIWANNADGSIDTEEE